GAAGADTRTGVGGLGGGGRVCEPLAGHDSNVTAVAVGELHGRAIAVSGSEDFTVRMWDLEAGQPLGTLGGHEVFVRAVALGELGGRPIAVSGGDDETVRVWDLDAGRALGGALRGDGGSGTAVAGGTLDGRPLGGARGLALEDR